MTTAKHETIDFAVDDPSTIKNKIANNSLPAQRIVGAFQCYPNSPLAMTLKIAAGGLMSGGTLLEVAIQTTVAFVAPSVNPRIDRIVLDPVTGVYAIVAGVEAAVPVAPAIPTSKLPCAQIALATSTTVIGGNLITDERSLLQGRPASNPDLERAVRRGRLFAALNLV